MKKIIFFTLIIFSVLGLFLSKNSKKIERVIYNSKKYTNKDINEAMDIVIPIMKKWPIVKGKVWYDENKTYNKENVLSSIYETDEVIIIYSDFKTNLLGPNSGFGSNQKYYNYFWILTRNIGGTWKLEDHGY